MAFGSLRNFLSLVRQYGIDRPYWQRFLFVLVNTTWTAPLRWYGRIRYGRLVRQTPINHPPLFILGHWRNGTTYLFNLLSQDPAFTYITLTQIMAPELFLPAGPILEKLFRRLGPSQHYLSRQAFNPNVPSEEEFAIANLSPYSLYHFWSFPRQAQFFLNRYVFFQDASPEEREAWKSCYRQLLQSLIFYRGNKPLLLKNPPNTGRIPILLEMFPEARFVFILRNPYKVYKSAHKFYRKILAITSLQDVTEAEVDQMMFSFYRQLMQAYLQTRDLIPPENLVEVKLETLSAAPLPELHRIYTHLRLSGWATAEPHFQRFVQNGPFHPPPPYTLTAAEIEQVNQEWGFAFDAWGYEMLPPKDGQSV